MRTTITIDDDVAKVLERIRRSRRQPLKSIVNEALRKGLAGMQKTNRRERPYRTPTASLGRCRLGSLDNIAEVISIAEGDNFI